ncbi:MAG TPA: methyltransferase domain-containing protein [Sulfolobales archaeon]|nr:methyltransferase domain-containing protein [Sulfolobales archaeon]
MFIESIIAEVKAKIIATLLNQGACPSMIESVVPILLCPKCSSELREERDHLICTQCGARYSIIDGRIIDFLGSDQGWVGLFERFPILYDPWSRVGWRLSGRGPLERFYEELTKNLSGGILVDAGCGTGSLLSLLERKQYRGSLIGIDISLPMLKIASRKTKEAVFLRASIDRIPIASGTIDHYISSLVIHIFKDKAKVISEISRILKKGGSVRIAVATTDSIRGRIFNRLLAVHAVRTSDYISLFNVYGIEILRTVDFGTFKAFYGLLSH